MPDHVSRDAKVLQRRCAEQVKRALRREDNRASQRLFQL
jgi:hypothetical protein